MSEQISGLHFCVLEAPGQAEIPVISCPASKMEDRTTRDGCHLGRCRCTLFDDCDLGPGFPLHCTVRSSGDLRCKCTYVYTYIHTYIYIYVCMYVRTYVRMYVCTYMHIYTYKYAYTYMYVYIYNIHMYMCIYDLSLFIAVWSPCPSCARKRETRTI